MDSLKTVAEKVKRSPQVIRKKLAAHTPKHEELREDWLHQPEPLNDGVPFYVKYLGTRQVYKAQGTGCTDEAVKHIVEDAKRHKKARGAEAKLQKVLLTVATKNISVEDMQTKEVKLEVPIYRVSYCTADPFFPKVFAFIIREQNTKNLFCHALLCSKESMAQAISLTVADAFTVAFASIKDTRSTVAHTALPNDQNQTAVTNASSIEAKTSSSTTESIGEPDMTSCPNHVTTPTDHVSVIHAPSTNPFKAEYSDVIPLAHSPGNPFIQPEVTLSDDAMNTSGRTPFIQVTVDEGENGIANEGMDMSQRMKALDLAVDDDFDAEFTRLAESRSTSNLFETPVRRTDFRDDVTTLVANDQTAKDLMKSRSAEDLFFLQ